MGKHIVYGLIVIALGCLGFYLGLPTINYGFYGLPFLIFFVSGIIYTLELFKKIDKPHKRVSLWYSVIFWISLSYIVVIPIFTTWAIFKSTEYHNLIGDVKIGGDFTKHVAPISTEEIRIVDQSIAYRLGDKVLGTKPSLGSQAHLGKFNIQEVKGQLYWVAPLLHSGYFKWQSNKQGTIGYVIVSATNERDVKLVQEINGKPIRLKYQQEAFFSDNLERHVFFNGYLTKGFTDFTFEIDDTGKPYWIITLFDKTVGFSGANATGILTVNPETGKIKEYSLTNAPKWIDRIQPEEFISEQLDDWGEYVKGYWNFANENKLTTTDGISLVYGADHKAYWYTGLSSVGSDEGTVGFVLVNTRTKKTVWYKQVGATEQAAQQSAMGKVQEKGYYASFPITYNINGIPTYVMSLKDQAGLVKMLAMVSVEDYTVVGVGNNIKETLREYKNVINSKGNAIVPSSFTKSYEIKATVSRISIDIRNGNTYYYLLLKNNENKIFVGSSSISNKLPITQINDSVRIKYDDGANEIVDIISFDNMSVHLQKTNKQIKKEEYFKKK